MACPPVIHKKIRPIRSPLLNRKYRLYWIYRSNKTALFYLVYPIVHFLLVSANFMQYIIFVSHFLMFYIIFMGK